MKRMMSAMSALALLLSLSACGSAGTNTQTAENPESDIVEVTAEITTETTETAAETTTDTTAETTAETAEVTAQTETEADPLAVLTQITRGTKRNHMVRNPDKGGYYDDRYLRWDSEKQAYADVSAEERYAMELEDRLTNPSPADLTEVTPYEMPDTIPEELTRAAKEWEEAFYRDKNALEEKDPGAQARSDGFDECGAEEFAAGVQIAVQNFDTVIALACNQHELSGFCVRAVTSIFSTGWGGQNMLVLTHNTAHDAVMRQYSAGTLSAESVAKLTETYGYLTADTLQDIGQLDLLIPADDAPCTDTAQLADFARMIH